MIGKTRSHKIIIVGATSRRPENCVIFIIDDHVGARHVEDPPFPWRTLPLHGKHLIYGNIIGPFKLAITVTSRRTNAN